MNIENIKIDEAITEAELEYENEDKLFDAKEVLSLLRRKHFD